MRTIIMAVAATTRITITQTRPTVRGMKSHP